MTPIESIARAIANELGDGFDSAHVDKQDWNRTRGMKNGRFRDVNEPRQDDFLAAARAALVALREPDPSAYARAMRTTGMNLGIIHTIWTEVIDAALEGQ